MCLQRPGIPLPGRTAPRLYGVWRREAKAAEDAGEDVTVTLGEFDQTSTGIDIAHAAEAARTLMRAEAADLGGPSPLVTFRDTPEAGIDISKAHPGSLPPVHHWSVDAALEPVP